MPRLILQQAVILVVAIVVLFTNLGATRLWDQDEAYFAGAAAEMQRRGDWVTPYFNGELFSHKPPLMFWMMICGYEIFGHSELAARFWSAVCGVAAALLTFHMGRRLFSAEVGFWAALALVTCLMFDVVARAATPDCFLVFFTTLAIYFFATRCERFTPNAADRRRSRRGQTSRASRGMARLGAGLRVDGAGGVGEGADRRVAAGGRHWIVSAVDDTAPPSRAGTHRC